MTASFIHQIFYDEATRARLDPGFLPLDNTANPRPDWYEFEVMLRWLREHELRDDAWYGFLSPRFHGKVGLDSRYVLGVLQGADADVALFSAHRDQVAYYLNVFEQGEACHPGLLDLMRQFLRAQGIAVDPAEVVMDSRSAVFSNYVVARKRFWLAWRELAERFWHYVEHQPGIDPRFHGLAPYASGHAPFKTFLQERLASFVLATGRWRTLVPDFGEWCPINPHVFDPTPRTRRQLEVCDYMKARFLDTGDAAFLEMYRKVRAEVTHWRSGSNIPFALVFPC